MNRIIIIGEGQTEQEYCKDVLIPYFSAKGIYVQNPTIKLSNGGIVSWSSLKKEIENHLTKDRTAIVTTLIDYYGIREKHAFPNWIEAKTLTDKTHRMEFIEKQMKCSIMDSLRNRFIPYIQLHEFEGLLFNRIEIFKNNFTADEADIEAIETIINSYPNPELLNNGEETAPSKRLERHIKGYKKVVYGAILATEIGLDNIRARCPRFNNWIQQLEQINQQS